MFLKSSLTVFGIFLESFDFFGLDSYEFFYDLLDSSKMQDHVSSFDLM